MVKSAANARRVGDSLVITLKKPVVDEAGIAEGDSLVMEVVRKGQIILMKQSLEVDPTELLKLELEVLKKQRESLEAQFNMATFEHNVGFGVFYRGVDDETNYTGYQLQFVMKRKDFDAEIAEKEVELMKLGLDLE